MRATSAPTSKPLSLRTWARLGMRRAVLVDEVDHVGVAVAAQAQQERLREMTDHPLHQVPPPAILRVVQVHDEAATDVDQQHRVLTLVGDAQHPHAVGDPHPRPVGQHLDAVAVAGELAGDPAADVVGQQDAGVAEQREGRRVQVVGVSVREPHRARSADGRVLGRRDLVREPPTAEIGRTAHPRIGREHRLRRRARRPSRSRWSRSRAAPAAQ